MTHSDKKNEALEGEILGRNERAPRKHSHWAVYLSVALIIFIGGVFAAPFGERALVKMGLLEEEKPSLDVAPFIKQAEDLAAAQSEKIESLGAVIAALEKYESAQSDELKDLASRVGALEKRPAGQANEGMVAAPVDLGPVLARIEALEAHSTHPTDVDLSAVEARIRALEQRETQTVAATGEMIALQDMAREAEHRAAVETLAVEYAPLITAALRANARGVDDGVWAQVKGWAKSLVVVRSVDNLEGDALAARLGRAEQALKDGTLSGLGRALDELQSIEGPALGVLEPWIVKARAVYETFLSVGESGAKE